MGKLNARKAAALAKDEPHKTADGNGLYSKRVYTKEIRSVIGKLKIDQVTVLDVREVIRRIVDSNRPTIANDTLMYI
ncbi:hypothetical protein BSQ33_09520 [Vibrio gazogenes]|uniref:Integrase n=1 Tax=Vibrio gazogenes TaxID=687 RepID=A0A1Z2SFM7_VIBGA|nr:hypothetical protein BSQ33_09520 [Vibrio gazogenes]